MNGVTVNTIELALQAAVDGLGVARVPAELAAPFLRTGQLTRVLEKRWKAIFSSIKDGGRSRLR